MVSLLSRIKGWFNNPVVKEMTGRSEGVTVNDDMICGSNYDEVCREIDRLTGPLTCIGWPKPKPSHVENYLGAYGSNRYCDD